MPERCDLSLVLACYNEEAILKKNFKEIAEILNLARISYEIIFVDDCSKDKTRDIIDEIINEYKNLRIQKFFHSKNEGRGKTVSDGFRMASGDVVGYIDVDLEVSPNYIMKCFSEIEKNYDIIYGWRVYRFFLHSWQRYILSKGYIRLVSFIYKTPLMDTESGYKFFKRDKILSLLDESSDGHWFWDTEVMIRAYYRGFKINHIPVLFMRRFEKKSTVNMFRDTINYLIKLIEFRKEINYLKNESV